jgi:alpha-N-acetylglucosaminidase
MLNNFGGNTFLWGRMEAVAHDPATVLHAPGAGRFSGIGLAPEGIEENPALYQLMLDNTWRDSAITLSSWLPAYVAARYGRVNADALAAWRVLAATVYAGGLGEGGPESIIVARPTTAVWADRVRTKLDYEPRELARAWGLMVRAADSLGSGDGFCYDLVDITRQVLANYALPLQQRWVLAYLDHDFAAFDSCTASFLALMDDMDDLLATRREFLLGRWIGDARRCGATVAESDLYEKNARDLITLWGDKESGLHEYACRQWSGLIKDFYKPRWQQYFVFLRQKMSSGDRMEETVFDAAIKDWEWKWVNTTHGGYAEQPVGDALTEVRRLYKKYATLVLQ